jgi:hypothetical protein
LQTASDTATTNIAALQTKDIVPYYYQDGNVISTTSTSNVDMTSVTVSIPVEIGDKIQVVFSASFSHSATNVGIYLRLFRDSTGLTFESAVHSPFTGTGGDKCISGLNFSETIAAAGTVAYKMQWKTSSGTAYCGPKFFNVTHFKMS